MKQSFGCDIKAEQNSADHSRKSVSLEWFASAMSERVRRKGFAENIDGKDHTHTKVNSLNMFIVMHWFINP